MGRQGCFEQDTSRRSDARRPHPKTEDTERMTEAMNAGIPRTYRLRQIAKQTNYDIRTLRGWINQFGDHIPNALTGGLGLGGRTDLTKEELHALLALKAGGKRREAE